MSLDYNKIKNSNSGDSQWSSYSDLFMVLSMVFLLLYVTSSLRSGTYSLQKNLQLQDVQAEREALRKEQAVYETLKDNYLETKATDVETQTYKDLMDKLVLLQDGARNEKNQLRARSLENEKKEKALNKYQQIIRNIINANVLAKSGLKERDVKLERRRQRIAFQTNQIRQKNSEIQRNEETIREKQDYLEQNENKLAEQQMLLRQKNQEVDRLSQVVSAKKKIIHNNDRLITKISQKLASEIKALKRTKKLKNRQRISANRLKKEIKKLKLRSSRKISNLKKKNIETNAQLKLVSADLSGINQQLDNASREISNQEAEKQNLTRDLAAANKMFEDQVEKMEDTFAQKLEGRRREFASRMNKEKVSQEIKEREQAKFQEQLREERLKLEGEIASLSSVASENKKKLDQVKKDNYKYKDYINTLEDQKNNLKGYLRSAKQLENARKRLAKVIKRNFRKAGVRVDVDPKSGDVVLSFGSEYFETGKFALKKKMKAILQKFMPLYAESLFKDKKVAQKIESVEIVGFASPTYKGKYVDPKSLEASDRVAVNYNLDLSYNRAREIFRYIFDKTKISYKYQSSLLPKVKVTGRSFLANGVEGRDLSKGLSIRKYCRKYNCKKQQKVIIKFGLAD